jgi:hypothetical protein
MAAFIIVIVLPLVAIVFLLLLDPADHVTGAWHDH